MSAIGILGGMGPQASNKLYELLIKKTALYTDAAIDEDFPDIVLLNVPVPNFISDKSKLPEAKRMLMAKTKLLETAGCTINGIACNTVHLLLPELRQSTNVPFVSIPELVRDRLNDAGYSRAGLLATPTTLESTFYDEALDGIELVRPDVNLANYVEDCIYEQLNGKMTESVRLEFRDKVEHFRKENALDAVILGCTELPLVYGDVKPDNIIDTIELLAEALLSKYYV